MNTLKMILVAFLAVTLVACGDIDADGTSSDEPTSIEEIVEDAEPRDDTDDTSGVSAWASGPDGAVVIEYLDYIESSSSTLSAAPTPGGCQRALDEMLRRFGASGSDGSIVEAFDRSPDAQLAETGTGQVAAWTVALSSCAEGDFDTAIASLELATELMNSSTDRLLELAD